MRAEGALHQPFGICGSFVDRRAQHRYELQAPSWLPALPGSIEIEPSSFCHYGLRIRHPHLEQPRPRRIPIDLVATDARSWPRCCSRPRSIPRASRWRPSGPRRGRTGRCLNSGLHPLPLPASNGSLRPNLRGPFLPTSLGMGACGMGHVTQVIPAARWELFEQRSAGRRAFGATGRPWNFICGVCFVAVGLSPRCNLATDHFQLYILHYLDG